MDQEHPGQESRDHRAVVADILDRLAAMQPSAAWAEEWTERVLAVRALPDGEWYAVQETTVEASDTREGWLTGPWLDLVAELRRRMDAEGRGGWVGARFALADDGSAQVGFDRGETDLP